MTNIDVSQKKNFSELARGTWSSSTSYTIGDIVDNDGSSYFCIQNNTNQEPPNTTYWALAAGAGVSITTITASDNGDGTFDVTFNKSDGSSETITTPDLTGPQGPKGDEGLNWLGDWSAGTYNADDAVQNNGSSWVANTTTTQEPTTGASDWDLLAERGQDGDVTGPGSSTDNSVARFNGTDGSTVQDSNVIIDDSDNLSGVNNVTGIDNNFVTGTSGAPNDLSIWNSDGDLVDGPTPPTGTIVGTTDSQTLTNKTINADNNTLSNLAHGAEVDDPTSGVHGVTGNVVGTTDTQTLTNKTIDANNNTISNLAHGSEVDNPSSGVHGVTGNVVGTTDTQTLTNKRIESRTNTQTSTATLTPDLSSADKEYITAQAEALTIAAPTGTPVKGDTIVIVVEDNGTSQTISFNATYVAMGQALPTSTTSNLRLEIIAHYDGTDWLTSYTEEQ